MAQVPLYGQHTLFKYSQLSLTILTLCFESLFKKRSQPMQIQIQRVYIYKWIYIIFLPIL